MKKQIFTLLCVLLVSANSMFAATWLVEKTAGQWTNTSAATSGSATLVTTDLGAWLTNVPANDQVWIIGNTTFELSTAIIAKNGVRIYGGFAGTEGAIIDRTKGTNAWDFTNSTTLDGKNLIQIYAPANNNGGNLTLLEGVTITKGLMSNANGGAASLKKGTAIQNCIITACANTGTTGQTAGAVTLTSTAQLLNSYIHHNTSTWNTGGINIAQGGTIDGCTIDNNSGAGNAGAINLNSGAGIGAIVKNCTITNNHANGTAGTSTGNGSGIMIFQTDVAYTTDTEITNCLISGNTSTGATSAGSGIYANDTRTGATQNVYKVTNCTISNNSSTTNGGGFFYKAGGNFTFTNCTFDGNSTANISGGGAHIAGSTGTVLFNKSTFKNNSSGTATGGAINASVAFTANNCLIYKNTGNSVIQSSATYTMNNCTVASNFKDDGTSEAGCNSNSDVASVYTNSLFLGCGNDPLFVVTGKPKATVTYCGFEASSESKVVDYADKTGCIYTISSATFNNPTNGDYSLASNSTAINTGTTIAGLTTDIVGVVRPTFGAYDMGAYEFNTSIYNSGAWNFAPTSSQDVVMNDTYNAAGFSCNNLTVNAGKQFTLASGTLSVAGNLTLSSDATNGTATFVNDGGTLTVNGTTNVNQALTYRSWYMCSPVATAKPTADISRIKYYDETVDANNWLTMYDSRVESAVAYGANSFTAAKGYLVVPNAGITNLAFTGALNDGAKSIALTSSVTNTLKQGFNLVGNPYPSYLNWSIVSPNEAKSVYGGNSSDIDGTMWYRTKDVDTYKFQTVNQSGVSTTGGSNLIPPMQAFWVKAKASGGDLSLDFTNTMRAHNTTGSAILLKAPKVNVNQILRLQLSNAVNTDEAVVYFNTDAADTFDAFDSQKMSNEDLSIAELYTVVDNKQLVINGQNSIILNKEIPLVLVPGDASTLSINVTEMSNFPDVRLILSDKLLNKTYDITDGNALTLTDFSGASDRYSISFRSPGSTTAVDNINNKQEILVYRNANNNIAVNLKELGNSNSIIIFNSIGQTLLSKPITSIYTELNKTFTKGLYIVKVQIDGMETTRKVTLN